MSNRFVISGVPQVADLCMPINTPCEPDTELVEIIIKHSIGSYTTLGYIVDENKLAQAIIAAGYKKEKGDL